MLEEVVTKRQEREFLSMAKRLYRGNRNWVQPLDDDIRAVFDPAKNRMFEGGEAIRWIARSGEGGTYCRLLQYRPGRRGGTAYRWLWILRMH